MLDDGASFEIRILWVEIFLSSPEREPSLAQTQTELELRGRLGQQSWTQSLSCILNSRQ